MAALEFSIVIMICAVLGGGYKLVRDVSTMSTFEFVSLVLYMIIPIVIVISVIDMIEEHHSKHD